MDIRFFDTLESTNNYCKLLDLSSVEEFTVICARQQTAGIGQQGNVWVSEPYKNLTFSLILKPSFLSPIRQFDLTIALSVAVAETIDALLTGLNTKLTTQIKWPNDIYVEDNKICGILVTNQLSGNSIISSICGIGLNINQTDFPDWVPNPTSLKLLTGKPYAVDDILAQLLRNIQRTYEELPRPDSTLRSRYMQRLYRRGLPSSYLYHGAAITATIVDVDPLGHLMLQSYDKKVYSCSMKEIQFL